MLRFLNDYRDRDVTVVARRILDGTDGASVTVGPKKEGAIDIDGDHQAVFSTRARGEGENPLPEIPAAQVLDDDGDGDEFDEVGVTNMDITGVGSDTIPGSPESIGSGEGNDVVGSADTTQLREGSDAEISEEIKAMIDSGENLTKTGLPELPILNQRLAAKGIGQIDAERRTSLMPAPAQ